MDNFLMSLFTFFVLLWVILIPFGIYGLYQQQKTAWEYFNKTTGQHMTFDDYEAIKPQLIYNNQTQKVEIVLPSNTQKEN